MAMVKCSECQAEISNQAQSCPKCGAPVVTKLKGPTWWPWIIGFVAVFLLGAMLIKSKDPIAQAHARDRAAIQHCWKEYERKSLSDLERRFIAAACEKLEAQFRSNHGIAP